MPAEKVESLPEPARVTSVSAEKSIPIKRQWDPSWSDVEKRVVLAEETGLRFGVTKYGKVVPMLGGLKYREALVAADKQAFIHSMQPRRPHQVEESGADDMDAFLAMMLLLLTR